MGGGYGLYRKVKVIRALKKLARRSDKFVLEKASKENYKIKPVFCPDISFPVAANHKYVDGNIVSEMAKKLEKWGVCTKEDFFNLL